jgi:hypothetical protein
MNNSTVVYVEDSSTQPNNKENTIEFKTMFNTIFNKTNLVLFLWFLAIYVISYFLISMFSSSTNGGTTQFQLRFSRMIDFVFLFFFFFVVIITFFSTSFDAKEKILEEGVEDGIDFVDDPMSFFTLLFIILGVYLLIFVLQIPMGEDTKPVFISFVETFLWLLMLIIIFVDFFKYVLGINPLDFLRKKLFWISLKPTPTPGSTTAPKSGNEVFNISNNLYTYDDAQSVCSAFGASVATYDQIEDSYNKGGEWCNYGWSDGQMALFPTQKSTWQKLQGDSSTKNNCGRPGINGGFMANPYMKFGVNCYGKKPTPSPADLDRMKVMQDHPAPTSSGDKILEDKINYWKQNADTLLKINSYNNNQWSAFTGNNTIAPNTSIPNTAAPTTAAPTTAAPTTAAPTTAAPTTAAPTTAAPTTAAPTTVAPTRPVIITAAPTRPVIITAAPTTAAPTTAVPTTASPTTPVIITAAPTTPIEPVGFFS